MVDTLGLLLHAIVHPADVQDRDGGTLLLSTLFGMYPFLLKLFADAGYQGPQFANAVAKRLPHLAVEIVKRSDQAKGFAVLPMLNGLIEIEMRNGARVRIGHGADLKVLRGVLTILDGR